MKTHWLTSPHGEYVAVVAVVVLAVAAAAAAAAVAAAAAAAPAAAAENVPALMGCGCVVAGYDYGYCYGR